MSPLNSKDADHLFKAILSLKTIDECYLFFEDICTIKELQDLSQRFQVACQLDAGKNYNQVSADTGASSATISRVNKCLLYGGGGYKTAITRLKNPEVLSNESGNSNSEA